MMETDRRTPRSAGFSLVELLVVITIIGILVALLLPAVQAAREAARCVQCSNHLKQIGLALHNYHNAVGSFPFGNIQKSAGLCAGDGYEPMYSHSTSFGNWMIALLPYLEQGTLFDRYDLKYNNETAQNQEVRESFPTSYICPSEQEPRLVTVPASGPASYSGTMAQYAAGSYRAVACRSNDGENYFDSEMMKDYFPKLRGAIHVVGVWGTTTESIDDIKDGTSNTLMVGEYTTATSTNRRAFWAYSFAYYAQSSVTPQPRTLWGDYDRCELEGGPGDDIPCKRGWGSFYPRGIHFLLCDGSVRCVSRTVEMELLADMATIDGGEPARSLD